jgi:hypothetical protein
MPHQNTQSSKATQQNAATPSREPSEDGVQGELDFRPEPRSYTAHNYADASLAAPAAAEVADYMDEGDALNASGAQQGSTHTARPTGTEASRGQGAKTRDANRRMTRSGSEDQGTH